MTSYGQHFRSENHTSDSHTCLGDHVTHGASTVEGPLNVSGETILKDTVRCQGSGGLQVSSVMTVNQSLEAVGGINSHGNIVSAGQVDAQGGIFCNGDIEVLGNGKVHIGGVTSSMGNPSDTFQVTGSSALAGDTSVTGGLLCTSDFESQGRVKFWRDGFFTTMNVYSGDSGSSRLYFAGFTAGSQTANVNVSLRDISSIHASGDIQCNSLTETSDDMYKHNEEVITGATQTIKKLKPQIYDKQGKEGSQRESGLIAQEVYYDAPELRHLVHLGLNADESVPTPGEMDLSGIEPGTDPDYSSNGWSTDNPSALNYTGLIAYLVKTCQELSARIEALEN